MSRRARTGWCYICRDTGGCDITCESCGKKFHESCIKSAGLWDADDVKTDYTCADCRESNRYDTTCYICKKSLDDQGDVDQNDQKTEGETPESDQGSRKDSKRHQDASATISEATASEDNDDDGGDDEPPTPGDSTDSEVEGGSRMGRRSSRMHARAQKRKEEERRNRRSAKKKAKKEAIDLEKLEGSIVLCDGCSNSAHLRCLGLTKIPMEDDCDQWFCTECDPNSLTADAMKAARGGAAAGQSSAASVPSIAEDGSEQSATKAPSPSKKGIGGNVDICYVCQKSGRLLGCDFCEQSFHPRCIDSEFLEFEQSAVTTSASIGAEGDEDGDLDPLHVPEDHDPASIGKWRCPICRGVDPLKSMSHMRMSRTAQLKLSRDWQRCILQMRKVTKANRDKFIWNSRHSLEPFLDEKMMGKLAKKFRGATSSRGGRRRKRVAAEDSDATDMSDDAGSSSGVESARKKRFRRKIIVDGGDSTEQDEEAPTHQQQAIDAEKQAVEMYKNAEQMCEGKFGGILKQGVSLKNYQEQGVGWLLDSFFHKAGAILADEMGLGKTIQCLAFLSGLKGLGITGPHLIVVPLSTVGNWAREIRRFVPHLRFIKICGSRSERDHVMTDPVAAQGLYDLYITTYETVVTEESFLVDQFQWQCLILDEAHRIKNESGRIRLSLDRIQANMRVLLTGTPLQNNVKELFTLLNFLFPEVLQNAESFQRQFVKEAGASDLDAGEEIDENALSAVSILLSKMMLRRTKDLVVRLPRKVEHDLWLPLSPLSAFWYRKLLDVSEAAFQQQSVKKLWGTVVKMRICTCHPKGLVTRDAQLMKFKEVFASLGEEEEKELRKAADALRNVSGEEHVRGSSKLIFLDKFLTHLHCQNLRISPSYKRDYIQNVKDIYVRKHPLPVLPAVKPPIKKSPKAKAAAPESTAGDDPAGTTDGTDAEQAPAPTARQKAEKLKKERQAATIALQKEYEEKINEVARTAILQFQNRNEDPDFFLECTRPVNLESEGVGSVAASTTKTDGETAVDAGSELAMDGSDEKPVSPSRAVAKDAIPHKILVFTQFQLILDELEDYCKFRGFKYMRLDGSTNKMIRELDIREFNSPQSTHLVYLICTRAGGVGINLVTANHVILYDEDWNPFIDLQAIDRAHRIGQKREVHIWKLVTEWTVEERMAIRRMQKLKLDRILIQAHATNEEKRQAEDIEAADGEGDSLTEFSLEEAVRLIRYGREAIRSCTNDPEALDRLSIQDLMKRKRKDLPVAVTEPSTSEDEGGREEVVITLDEALDEDDKAEVLGRCTTGAPTQGDDEGPSSGSRPTMTDQDEEEASGKTEEVKQEPAAAEEVETAEGARRQRRARRRIIPPTILQPPTPVKTIKTERKVVHDKKCFKCGVGVAVTEQSTDPLIACHRCPRAYHKSCLNLKEGGPSASKRVWLCPWHECCLCFRKGSQAGGRLIHCAECPTTYCFDCFPPEYRRFNAPATYFADLQRRGYNVNPDLMVLFMCSRCRVLQEQARRKKLTKQQLDQEMKRRREINAKARLDAQQRAREISGNENAAVLVANLTKRSGPVKNAFLARKRQQDEQDREHLRAVKEEYERLFPQDFIEVLKQKRASQLASKASQSEAPTPAEIDGELKAEGSTAEASQTPAAESSKPSGGTKTMVSKLPSEYCRVCDNCRLPGHDVNQCPFPKEAARRPTEDGESKPGKKVGYRGSCPLCGVSSRSHSRRHCDLLTEEDKKEYENRRELVEAFIEELKKEEAVQLPQGAVPTVTNAESLRRILQRQVDQKVVHCLERAGLGNCVGNGGSLTPKRKRRRRSEDEASESDNEESGPEVAGATSKRPRTADSEHATDEPPRKQPERRVAKQARLAFSGPANAGANDEVQTTAAVAAALNAVGAVNPVTSSAVPPPSISPKTSPQIGPANAAARPPQPVPVPGASQQPPPVTGQPAPHAPIQHAPRVGSPIVTPFHGQQQANLHYWMQQQGQAAAAQQYSPGYYYRSGAYSIPQGVQYPYAYGQQQYAAAAAHHHRQQMANSYMWRGYPPMAAQDAYGQQVYHTAASTAGRPPMQQQHFNRGPPSVTTGHPTPGPTTESADKTHHQPLGQE